jgi:hypothetical protein
MTNKPDTSPEAVKRLISDCAAATRMTEETKTFQTGQGIFAECSNMIADLSEQLATTKADRDAARQALEHYADESNWRYIYDSDPSDRYYSSEKFHSWDKSSDGTEIARTALTRSRNL